MSAPAKLYYFSATGRANAIRFAMAASNIKFEDINANFPPSPEDVALWQKLGGNTTTNVPMLEFPDGKVYTQSSAVLRAVARRGGLMPSSDDDLYMVDKLLADAEDLRQEAYKSFPMFGASKESMEKFKADAFPKHASNLERQLGGNDFFIGSELTVADVAVYDAIVNFGTARMKEDALEKLPALKKWVKRVEENEGIAAYLASDQWKNVEFKFDQSTLPI